MASSDLIYIMEYLVQEKTAAVLQSTEKAKVRILQMHHQVKLIFLMDDIMLFHLGPRDQATAWGLGAGCAAGRDTLPRPEAGE